MPSNSSNHRTSEQQQGGGRGGGDGRGGTSGSGSSHQAPRSRGLRRVASCDDTYPSQSQKQERSISRQHGSRKGSSKDEKSRGDKPGSSGKASRGLRRTVSEIGSNHQKQRPPPTQQRRHRKSNNKSQSFTNGSSSGLSRQQQLLQESATGTLMSGVVSEMSENTTNTATKSNKYDVDVPSSRRKPPRRARSEESIESGVSRALMAELGVKLTPEQRAWAGVDSVLNDCCCATSNSGSGESESVDTRDVLPEEVVKAMNATSNSDKSNCLSAATTTSSSSSSPSASAREGGGSQQQPPSPPAVPAPSTPAPAPAPAPASASPSGSGGGLINNGGALYSSLNKSGTFEMDMNDSFANDDNNRTPARHFRSPDLLHSGHSNDVNTMRSTRSDSEDTMPTLADSSFSSLQSEITNATTCNYIVQNTDDGEEDGAAAPMQQFLGNLQENKTNVNNEKEEEDVVEEEEEERSMSDDSVEEEESLAIYEDNDDDEDGDDEHDPLVNKNTHIRQMLERYSRGDMPPLSNSSFASLESDVSGIQSIISTAKNFVVQKTTPKDVGDNPMIAFLSNMSRNIERRQLASELPTEEQRETMMQQRDDVADAQRAIIEQYEEEENNHHTHNNDTGDGCGSYYDENGEKVHNDHDNNNSMPSLNAMRESEAPIYPRHTTTITGTQTPGQPPISPPGDWRSWVDSARQEPEGYDDQQEQPLPSPTKKDAGLTPKIKGKKKPPVKKKRKKVVGQVGGPSYPTQPHHQGNIANNAFANNEGPVGFAADFGNNSGPAAALAAKDEEVISMSPLQAPRGKVTNTSPQQMDINSFASLGLPKDNENRRTKESAIDKRKKKMYKDASKNQLRSLKSKVSSIFSSSKGRRGSPTSIIDHGRGNEAQFFPSIDEEDEHDWGGLLSSS